MKNMGVKACSVSSWELNLFSFPLPPQRSSGLMSQESFCIYVYSHRYLQCIQAVSFSAFYIGEGWGNFTKDQLCYVFMIVGWAFWAYPIKGAKQILVLLCTQETVIQRLIWTQWVALICSRCTEWVVFLVLWGIFFLITLIVSLLPKFLGYLSETQIFVTSQLRHIPGEMCCIVFRPNETTCSDFAKAEKYLFFLCLPWNLTWAYNAP